MASCRSDRKLRFVTVFILLDGSITRDGSHGGKAFWKRFSIRILPKKRHSIENILKFFEPRISYYASDYHIGSHGQLLFFINRNDKTGPSNLIKYISASCT